MIEYDQRDMFLLQSYMSRVNIPVTTRQVCLLSVKLFHFHLTNYHRHMEYLLPADEACYSQGQEYSFDF
jgi:hypothetical protein